MIFRNTLSALAGMFRWREVEQYALLAERDPVASRVRNTLTEADYELARQADRVQRVKEKRDNIAAIIEYLDGKGDPNILHELDKDDDDGEDDNDDDNE